MGRLNRAQYVVRLCLGGHRHQHIAGHAQGTHLSAKNGTGIKLVVQTGEHGRIGAECKCGQLGPIALETAHQ